MIAVVSTDVFGGEMHTGLRRYLGPRTRLNRWGVGFAVCILLAACGSTSASNTASKSPTSTSAAGSKSPYIIHAILSETGPAGFLGVREAKALNALASQVNATGGIDGHPVQMSIQDNQSSPATSVSLATQLIAKKVPFILNGSYVATDLAVDALPGPNGPVIFDLSPGTYPKGGSMVFAAGTSTNLDAQSYLTFLKSKGITNIAAITSTDGSGIDGFKQLSTALAKPEFSSFHLLSHQTFDPTAVSVITQLSVIKATNPQALIIWTTGTPLGTVLKGMSSLGMQNIPTVTTNGNAIYSELTNFASILPKTLYFPVASLDLQPSDISSPAVKAKVVTFDKAVTSNGGHPSDAWALGWDPAALMIHAIQHLGVNATALQIRSYMQKLSNFTGVYGTYNFSVADHRGLSASDVYITQWNGKSYTLLSGPGGSPLKG